MMRKIKMKHLCLFLLLVIGGLSSFAQDNKFPETCLTDQLLKLAIQKDPKVKNRLDLLNSKINERKFQKTSNVGVDITIPVVIFVVHENGIENIIDNQIFGQLNALNQYFSAAKIHFCLATLNDFGQATSGILRFNSPLTHNSIANANSLETLTNPNAYTSLHYLKIWIVKDIEGSSSSTNVQGYATFPGTNMGFEGIVIKASAFGTVTNCGGGCSGLNPSTQLGKVLVHETGHYLGLYHTFEQGCAGGDLSTCATAGDRVCDTPPVANHNFSCSNAIDSCPDSQNLPDDISNYMDYVTETCMTHFSDGQIQRMDDLIYTERSVLISPLNLLRTGVTCIPNINCFFNASNYEVCSNNGSVTFSPDYNPAGFSYAWNFGDSSTSTIQNPTHVYTTASTTPYIVTLTVSDGNGNSATSSKMVFVKNCTPIINSESEWRFGNSKSISFATGVPVVQTPQNSYNDTEACANQSNSSGQMLFHSSGNKVYDGNNLIVATTWTGRMSSHQGALILPNPNPQFPNQYYLFLRKAYEQQLQDGGFTYTLVNAPTPGNVTLDPQNTEVPITIPSGYNYITGPYGIDGIEGVTAIKSCDGYWIITAGLKNSGYYLVVFKLNSSGLNFISEYSIVNTNINTKITAVKASPNGNKIVLFADRGFPSTGGLFLYDFNKFTGVITNQKNLNHDSIYGAAFSPDSNLLYVSANVGEFKKQYLQYNLNDTDPFVSRKSFFNTLGRTSELKIGPDNKIYLATTSNDILSVIHNPNNIITDDNPNACQFYNYGPTLSSGPTWMGLPNLVDAKSETAFNNTISSNPTSCKTYSFFANVCDTNFTWNFGDSGSGASNSASGTNVSHTFSAEGTYTVTLTDSNSNHITTTISVGIATPVIAGDSSACLTSNTATNNSVVLSTGERALWSVSGGTIMGFNNQSSIDVNWTTLPGTITLTVTNAAGCTRTVTKTITSTEGCPQIPIAPTFDTIEALCQNSIPPLLPTTSNNQFTGTWNPTTIDTSNPGVFPYTFTPANLTAATPLTISITINPSTTPAFRPIGPFCEDYSSNYTLPTASLTGITGSWNPSTVNQAVVGTATYVFTPSPNQGTCISKLYLDITVLPKRHPICDQNFQSCDENITLSEPEVNGLNYSYKVSDWIITDTNYIVSDHSEINLLAQNYILIKSNTLIASGSKFLAKIENCPNPSKNTLKHIETNIINIYPNPSNDYVTVSSINSDLKSITICSMEGKVFYTNKTVNGKSYQLNINHYQNGMYIINVNTADGKTFIQKLIKN